MKHTPMKTIPLLLMLILALTGCTHASAAGSTPQPGSAWPTHAPGATPYVRVYPAGDAQAESAEFGWDSVYDAFGSFYAKDWELELFRALPQDAPFAFVPFSPHFVMDEGEAMRMARLFDGLDGCSARVIAMHQITDGLDVWGFLTVVEMTPGRLFELSEELDERFRFEQFYSSVEELFDIAYWPEGIHADGEDILREAP